MSGEFMILFLSQLLKYFQFETHYPYEKTADAVVVPIVVAEVVVGLLLMLTLSLMTWIITCSLDFSKAFSIYPSLAQTL